MSIPLLLAVFILGFAMGAFLVALERRSRIEKIRREFQSQLEALVHRAKVHEHAVEAGQPASETKGAKADPSRAA